MRCCQHRDMSHIAGLRSFRPGVSLEGTTGYCSCWLSVVQRDIPSKPGVDGQKTGTDVECEELVSPSVCCKLKTPPRVTSGIAESVIWIAWSMISS